MRAVGCFLEYRGKFVILLRNSHKPDGDTWGLPGGKVEAGEQDIEAMLRELKEETGYEAKQNELEHLGDYKFTSITNQPYVFATYRVRLKDMHTIELEQGAHAEYKWITPRECYARADLVKGTHELLRITNHI